jgi:hypothetical protein
VNIRLNQKTRNSLWWLIISVDYNYSRIRIEEHELTTEGITLWLEDTEDFKDTIDECLEIFIPLPAFASFIRTNKFNSYRTQRMHPEKKFLYDIDVEINSPLRWYEQDATTTDGRAGAGKRC